MTKLNQAQKVFIVQQLATYSGPQEVADLVKEEFGVEITRQAVANYSPTTNPKLRKDLKKIFEKTRKEFDSGLAEIPISVKYYRLHELNRIYQRLKAAKTPNTKAMREVLEQAAKEAGDAFSNKIKHDVDASVQHSVVRVPPKLSPEDWIAIHGPSGALTPNDEDGPEDSSEDHEANENTTPE